MPIYAQETEIPQGTRVNYQCSQPGLMNEMDPQLDYVEVTCGPGGEWIYPVPMTGCVGERDCPAPILPSGMRSDHSAPVTNGDVVQYVGQSYPEFRRLTEDNFRVDCSSYEHGLFNGTDKIDAMNLTCLLTGLYDVIDFTPFVCKSKVF